VDPSDHPAEKAAANRKMLDDTVDTNQRLAARRRIRSVGGGGGQETLSGASASRLDIARAGPLR
jgi:hypothetical protein